MSQKIKKNMTLGEIANKYPGTLEIFSKYDMPCVGCHVAGWETLEQGAVSHGIVGDEFDKMMEELNKKTQNPKSK